MSESRLAVTSATFALALVGGCFNVQTAARHSGIEELLPAISLASSSETPCNDSTTAHGFADTPATTVASPQLPLREIGRAECIALALEHGRTGVFFDRAGSDRRTSAAGLLRDALPSTATDSIRVAAYDPAVLGTEIEESLAKFDAILQSSLTWSRTDRASRDLNLLPTPLEALGNADRLDAAQFHAGVIKPLPTGGVAGITFRSDYENDHLPAGPGVLNSANRTAVDFTFEQPLLQGAGAFINQLRDTHPGSVLNPFPVGVQVPGILLARIAFTETQLEFERRVQDLLFAVEEAYWDLYCAYWDLYSRDQGMCLARDVWQLAKAQFQAGGIAEQDLAQIEVQYQLFRTQRLEALGNGGGRPGVLEAERRLRYVLGLPAEDGTRLIPCESPVTGPQQPDWKAAVADALAFRPELVQVRQEIRATQLDVQRARNLALPDLRFISRVSPNGLASNPGGSLHDFGELNHADWELGLQLQVPIGTRAAYAELTRARLRLDQRFAFLRDQEEKVILSLQRAYRSLVQFREEMETRRSQRRAVTTQLKALLARFKAGDRNSDILVRTQQIWADALRDEQVAICNYNTALADFERQKGTILQFDNVHIAEGGLPRCAQQRASEHVREFDRAIRLTKNGHENADAGLVPYFTADGKPRPAPSLFE